VPIGARLPALVGLALLGAVAMAASALSPWAISPLLLALVAGLAVANLAPGLGERLRAGAGGLPGMLLRIGIILLGARASVELVAEVGPHGIAVVLATMLAVFGFVALAARRLRLVPELAVLLAVGTAVCGNSAIAAAAPLIHARRPEVALAIGTVTLFGTVALFAYPLLGATIGLDDRAFGIWAGAGVHDTAQVVATAFAFSPDAGEVATLVKLGRNALMLPILVALAVLFRAEGSRLAGARSSLLLVGGYAAVAGVSSAGLLTPNVTALASAASSWALVVAMAGVGVGIRVAELRALGRSAVLTGLAASIIGGAVALAVTMALAG